MRVERLSYFYKSKQILNDVNFELKPASLNVLLGANGSGKSTLFKAILSAKSGVFMGTRALKSSQIAYVPQASSMGFDFSLFEVVLMGARLRFFGALGVDKESIKASNEALNMLNIAHLKDAKYCELSGGYKQLGLIAKALAARTQVILMDEPTSALDAKHRYEIWELLRQLADSGKMILVCAHEAECALNYADTLLGLKDANLVQLNNDLKGLFSKFTDANLCNKSAKISDEHPCVQLIKSCLGLNDFRLSKSYSFLPITKL